MTSRFRSVAPDQLRRVNGFLGERFRANTEGRLKNWALVEEYISLHERKNHDEWFWIGEQAGKWLDAAAYAAVISGDGELRSRVLQAVDRLAASQERDGYVGVTAHWWRNPVRGMQLYEWYFLLHGLLCCHELLGSERALEVATRLGRYIVERWGTRPGQFPLMGRYPGNGHDGGEGTLILEPMALLGARTGDGALIEWCVECVRMWDAWADQYPESRHTGSYSAMRAVAEGAADVHTIRENVHAHTLHMTLLGLAALHEATGEAEYRHVVLGCVDAIRDTCVFITGGMSSGERYVPYPYYNPRNDIEVCPQHSWVLLCEKALSWTGDARYAEEIERTLLNNFLAAQRRDGSNWHYMIPMNRPAKPVGSPNCCNSSGARLAARIPTFLYAAAGGGIAANLYCDSELAFKAVDAQGGTVDVRLVQRTSYPSDGRVEFLVRPERPARFPLLLRIPSFAGGTRIAVNGGPPEEAAAGTYHAVEREWKPGDQVTVAMPLPVRVHAGPREAALLRGPLVYAYFQSLQDDPQRFYWNPGVYPDDVELAIDPADPAASCFEARAPEGLLGPALRVRALQKPRAPVFAHPGANRRLPGERPFDALLLPFANQGAQEGPYAVFLSYRPGKAGEGPG